jgi:hypothetical protein
LVHSYQHCLDILNRDVDRIVRVGVATCAACTNVAAGVMHEDVDRTELGDRLVDDALHILRYCQVSDDPQGLNPVLGTNVSGGLGESGAAGRAQADSSDREFSTTLR